MSFHVEPQALSCVESVSKTSQKLNRNYAWVEMLCEARVACRFVVAGSNFNVVFECE